MFLSQVEVPNPLKRCLKCKNCTDCRKVYLPSQQKNEVMNEKLKESVTYNHEKKFFEAKYTYNSNLKELPIYKDEVLNMMKNLERRLVKSNKVSDFNSQIDDFFSRGVLEWIPTNEMDGKRQQSFIPLTFAEKSEGTTKLRVCGNSAFSSSNKVSFNGCQVPGPNNLTSLMGCLLLFRSHHQIVLGDIRKCFHQVRTDPVTNDLRRVWLRPGGLGSGGSWRQARFMRMSFGDLLAPPLAVLIIAMCICLFMKNEDLKKRLKTSIYMDDVLIPVMPGENPDALIKQTAGALETGGFEVKTWVKTGDRGPPVKYLSYDYLPEQDRIRLRLKFNISKKKRGIRMEPDILSFSEFSDTVARVGLTKRNIASLLAGVIFDPLCLLSPYISNLKIAYRNVCRKTKDWDEKIAVAEQNLVTKTIEKLFKVQNILIPRAVFLQGALKYNLMFFFDASGEITKTSVVVQNKFPGKDINRLLMDKVKLCDSAMSTTPRKELGAAHLCSRVKAVVCYHLGDFLNSLGAPWYIIVLSDSTIVLSQVASLPYFYKPYVAARLAEIQENLPESNPKIQFKHVRSEANIADIGTRVSFPEPQDIPWLANDGDIKLREDMISDPLCLNVAQLPDTKKNEISVQNLSQSFYFPPISVKQLVSVQLPLEPKLEQKDVDHQAFQLIDDLLKRKSLFVTINVLARIWKWRHKNVDFHDCQMKMRNLIFIVYQKRNPKYVQNFGGHIFTKIMPKDETEPVFLQCRENLMGTNRLLLVPKKTRLFDKVVEQYHSQTGHRSDEFIRFWMIRRAYICLMH